MNMMCIVHIYIIINMWGAFTLTRQTYGQTLAFTPTRQTYGQTLSAFTLTWQTYGQTLSAFTPTRQTYGQTLSAFTPTRHTYGQTLSAFTPQTYCGINGIGQNKNCTCEPIDSSFVGSFSEILLKMRKKSQQNRL